MGFRGSSSGGGGGVAFAGPSGQIDAGDINNEGALDAASRADHQHAFPGPTGAPPALAAASAAGASARQALQDHTHSHTAAQHLGGGHADLSGDFAAITAPGAAVTAHEGAADPHPAYQLEANALAGADVVLKALADAKGDLIAATGIDTFARLPVGLDGEFLVADSSQLAGVKYAAGPSAGVTDHGALTGLADDDHPQYLKGTRVTKGANESLTSNNTAQNDDELLAPVDANTTYDFEATVLYDGTMGADIRIGWAIPAGASIVWAGIGPAQSITATDGSGMWAGKESGAVIPYGATSNTDEPAMVIIRGRLVVDATPGTLQLQWAQLTSSAAATTVRAGSSLAIREAA